jgi:hypothetical protein
MMSDTLKNYDEQMASARDAFTLTWHSLGIHSSDTDPDLLELFLIYFTAFGVRTTEPVEGWIRRAGERCEEMGLGETGRSLRAHAKAEAGHNLMMVRDVHKLAARWNSRHQPVLYAAELLALPPGPGACRYIEVHENNIAGCSPFAQVAIEYEIERLPIKYGENLIRQCVALLGKEILECLEFLTEHVELDVGHTKFNAKLLSDLIAVDSSRVRPLAKAGTDVLAAYGQFLTDCASMAREKLRKAAS